MKPYHKAQLVPLVGLQDRRRRLTDNQREEIRELYAKGDIGTRRLAAMFRVSRSLVMFIVSPERAQAVRDRFKAHWRDYARKHGKAYHAASIRNTRNYKYKLYKENQTRKDNHNENKVC